ncbi:DMT family transporter [Kineosporia sp. J2-2]|uniref:DMT family transporter n=1 Tax=Kineosporia corallincola TaxID=2835133 RepID=A0ABS5TME9_9ACTN|nr:DMT family transporter [Kineosporia corallincola]MBT0772279.1 DMT family transporter [Kineosporia corallincola]
MVRPNGLPRLRRVAGFLFLAILFVVCWSSGFVGAKLGAQDADVLTVLMWRFLPLAAVLIPITWARRERVAVLRRDELPRQIAIGALSQSGYLVTVYGAISLGVSSGTTALVDGVQPLVVAACAGPLLGVAVTGRQWLGLALGLIGVVAVTWADATAPGGSAPVWAYTIPLAGMLCLVAATFLERRARARVQPLHVLTVHCTTSAVVFTGLAVAGGAATVPGDARFWFSTAWLVLFPTFGGYGLYWLLLDRAGVTVVNSLMFLVPPVTTAWGAVMFGEPVTRLTVGGLALALIATWLVVRNHDQNENQGRREAAPDEARPMVATTD